MRASLLALTIACLLPACGLSEADVREELRKANTCTTASDCVDVGSYCPYGCSVLVNKSSADSIRMLVQSHSNPTCFYDCAPLVSIACENRVCVGKIQ